MSKRYHQTMEALEASLTCSLIASELGDGPGGGKEDGHRHGGILPETAGDEDIVKLAREGGYTHVFLYKEMVEHEPPWWLTKIAWVEQKAPPIVAKREILSDDILSADTPVANCIHLLRKRSFYLVLERDRLRYVVTRADLNRLPVRTYLSTQLAHLEGLLAEFIDKRLPDNDWLPLLAEERQAEACSLYEMKKNDDFDTRLIDCTLLSDKMQIVRDEPEVVGAPSKTQVGKQAQQILKLRNRLAHNLSPLPPLEDDGDQLRNHLLHGQPLVDRGDLSRLCDTEKLIKSWIDALATAV